MRARPKQRQKEWREEERFEVVEVRIQEWGAQVGCLMCGSLRHAWKVSWTRLTLEKGRLRAQPWAQGWD